MKAKFGFTLKRSANQGFTLIEAVVSIAAVAIVATSLFPLIGWLVTRFRGVEVNSLAARMLQEGMEATYSVFLNEWDAGRTTFPDGEYHPVVEISGGDEIWTLLPGSQTGLEARFERKVTLEPVCRNAGNGNIIPGACDVSSPLYDSYSRWVRGTVSWVERDKVKEVTAKLLLTSLER